MTTTEFNQNLPVGSSLPESWDDSHEALTSHLRRIANAVNNREVGWVVDTEIDTGKRFIAASGSTEYRTIFRKAIDTGTLPNNTTSSIAHGLTVDANFTLIEIYGGGTDPIAFTSIPLNYVSSAGSSIEVNMDASNINIVTTGNYSAYTRSFVVIEYMREI